jgi:hypothetical protein
MMASFDQANVQGYEQVSLTAIGSGRAFSKKEDWSAPLLIRIDAAAIQQEEEGFYRALLGMSDTEFRLLSGSGR